MARTAEGTALTRRYRAAQLRLRAGLLRDFTRLWSVFDPSSVTTFGVFADVAVTLIQARHQDSAGLAGGYFRAFRRVEGIQGEATVRLASRLLPVEITASLRATGLAGTMRALRAGQSPQAAKRTGFVQASGSAGRLALTGGNDTIIGSAQADRRALGWQRVTSSDPCAFCRMLASRGPVYKRERTASFNAHDHDACTAEVVYEGSELTGQAREFRRQWDEAQRQAREAGEPGLFTAKGALNAFRRYLSPPAESE